MPSTHTGHTCPPVSPRPATAFLPVHNGRQLFLTYAAVCYGVYMATRDEVANPSMVTVAREARGWSQSDLARHAGINQSYLSKVESGLLELSGERLEGLADVLDAPVALLTNHDPFYGLEVSCMFHRRRASKVTVAAGKRVEAIGHLTRITANGLVNGTPISQTRLERMDIDEFASAETIAELFRARWRVPSGPITNLMALMDHLGVIVVIRPVGTTGQDAFSTWPTNGMPMMVVNTGLPVDRLRFTVAHELGHILMHVLPNDDQEKQANDFASELLMPRSDIAVDLQNLTTGEFTRLMQLKAKWRASVGALVQRARSMDIISERQFKEFRIRMSQMGWNTSEPIELAPEYPQLLRQVIEWRRRDLGEDTAALATAAAMTETAFERYYSTSGTDSQPADVRSIG